LFDKEKLIYKQINFTFYINNSIFEKLKYPSYIFFLPFFKRGGRKASESERKKEGKEKEKERESLRDGIHKYTFVHFIDSL